MSTSKLKETPKIVLSSSEDSLNRYQNDLDSANSLKKLWY